MGLISDAAWRDYLAKQQRADSLRAWLENTRLTSEVLESLETYRTCHPERSEAQPSPVTQPPSAVPGDDLRSLKGAPLAQLLKRPGFSIEQLVPILRAALPGFAHHWPLATGHLSSQVRTELKSVETEIKYAGYLAQQERAIERLKKAEQRSIPGWFDYAAVSGLSREMKEKLTRVRPQTLAQAARIPGVTPAAVSLIHVYIEIQSRRQAPASPLAD